MSKFKVHKIKMPLFGKKLHLFIGSFEAFQKYARSKYKTKFIVTDSKDAYFYAGDEGRPAIIVIPNFEWTISQQSLLSHELLHFVFWVLADVGISLNEGSEEIYTYYFQEIQEKTFRILLKDYEN